jgi:hypothetical protein
MRLEQGKDEFAVRYYRWALGEARREVSERFPLLSSVKGAFAMQSLAYLNQFSPIEQIELLTALIKRFHQRFHQGLVELTGEPLTSREEALIRAKDEALLSIHLPTEAELGPLSADKRPPMNRSRFRTLLRREMVAQCGEPTFLSPGGESFRIVIGDWTISTVLEYGRRPFYDHRIYLGNVRPGEQRWCLQDGISVLSWLGLGQPSWDLARAGDENETVQSIRNCCARFLEAAPRLLEGLSIDAPERSRANS